MTDERAKNSADLLVARKNNFDSASGSAIRTHEREDHDRGGTKMKEADGEDENIPARILVARGSYQAMTYSQTQHT